MKTAIASLTVTVLLIAVAGCEYLQPVRPATPTYQENLFQLVNDLQPAVVTVVTYDIQNEVSGLGSGFFINSGGHLITNYHVLKGAYAARVKTGDGQEYSIQRVLAEDEHRDLIKVQVDMPTASLRWVTITGTEPAIAERVVVVGSPLGLHQTVSEGIVSAIRDLPLVGKIFQMSAPISPGSSGSPVLNMQAEVVGVVSFQTTVGQNLNFAVTSQGILDLVDLPDPLPILEWTHAQNRKQPGMARELCKQGFAFSIQGEHKQALRLYQEAAEHSPEDDLAWFGLGSCYAGLDRPEDAIEAFQQPIRIDPDNLPAHFNLANYYHKLDRLEDALLTYQEVLRIDADYAPAYFAMGMIYGRLERYREGLQAFKAVIRLHPGNALAYHFAGVAYAKLGRYEEALAAQQQALRLNPEFPPAYVDLGRIYAHLGRLDDEARAYKNALRMDPEFIPAHYWLGLWYLKNEEHLAALGQYKILRKLDRHAAEQLFQDIYGE